MKQGNEESICSNETIEVSVLRCMMNNFWSSVFAGSIGAVLSAATIAAIGELRPLGLHLIIPEDAVIPMSGECPSGWRRYDALNGQYIVAPMADMHEGQGGGPETGGLYGGRFSDGRQLAPKSAVHDFGARLVLPGQPTYVVLSLCQRR
jgi:hypothetical protein